MLSSHLLYACVTLLEFEIWKFLLSLLSASPVLPVSCLSTVFSLLACVSRPASSASSVSFTCLSPVSSLSRAYLLPAFCLSFLCPTYLFPPGSLICHSSVCLASLSRLPLSLTCLLYISRLSSL